MNQTAKELNAENLRHTSMSGFVCFATLEEFVEHGLVPGYNGICCTNIESQFVFVMLKFLTRDGKWHSVTTSQDRLVFDKENFMKSDIRFMHMGYSMGSITEITPGNMASIEKDSEEDVANIRQIYEKEYGDL